MTDECARCKELWSRISNLDDQIRRVTQESVHHAEAHKELLAWLKKEHPKVFSEALIRHVQIDPDETP